MISKNINGTYTKNGSSPIYNFSDLPQSTSPLYYGILSQSPAERIADIQNAGTKANTNDILDSDGKLSEVEVSYSDLGIRRTYHFFNRQSDCVNFLTKSQPIPDKYK